MVGNLREYGVGCRSDWHDIFGKTEHEYTVMVEDRDGFAVSGLRVELIGEGFVISCVTRNNGVCEVEHVPVLPSLKVRVLRPNGSTYEDTIQPAGLTVRVKLPDNYHTSCGNSHPPPNSAHSVEPPEPSHSTRPPSPAKDPSKTAPSSQQANGTAYNSSDNEFGVSRPGRIGPNSAPA